MERVARRLKGKREAEYVNMQMNMAAGCHDTFRLNQAIGVDRAQRVFSENYDCGSLLGSFSLPA